MIFAWRWEHSAEKTDLFQDFLPIAENVDLIFRASKNAANISKIAR